MSHIERLCICCSAITTGMAQCEVLVGVEMDAFRQKRSCIRKANSVVSDPMADIHSCRIPIVAPHCE
jgi:hypothetical protein